jgi:hypothetical protein
VNLSPSLFRLWIEQFELGAVELLAIDRGCSTLFDLPDTSATTSRVLPTRPTVSRASRETLPTFSLYRSWVLVIFPYQTTLPLSLKLLDLLRKLYRIDFEKLSNTRNDQIYLTKFEGQPCAIEIYDIGSVWRHPNRSLETTNNLPTLFGLSYIRRIPHTADYYITAVYVLITEIV